MNKSIKLILLGTLLVSTTAFADISKGKRLYMKKFKAPCGMTGKDFTHKHTQEEWTIIFASGSMKKEIIKICPNIRKVKDKWLEHMYDFSHEFASDSGNIASC